MELAGHASHTSDVAPTVVEYLPLPQSTQSSEPVSILYFPATHAAHVFLLVPDSALCDLDESEEDEEGEGDEGEEAGDEEDGDEPLVCVPCRA